METLQPRLDCISLSEPRSAEARDDASLLGDVAAMVALYQPRIFRFLLISVRDRDVALSLTQDTFLRAWRSRERFRGECGVYTWLMRIAVNLLRDHTRTERFRFWRRAAETSVDVSGLAAQLPHPASSAESRLIAREQLSLIWTTLGGLSVRQRSVFLLRFVDGLELGQIAEVTGLPVPTVKTHLYRALAAIRLRHAEPKAGISGGAKLQKSEAE